MAARVYCPERRAANVGGNIIMLYVRVEVAPVTRGRIGGDERQRYGVNKKHNSNKCRNAPVPSPATRVINKK